MDAHSSWGLRVLTVREGPRILITVEGDLDLASAPYLRSRLMPAAARPDGGPVRLDVDASGLSFVDVAGIAALVDVANATARAGGSFRLWRTTAQLDRLIDLLEIDVLRPESAATESPKQRARRSRGTMGGSG